MIGSIMLASLPNASMKMRQSTIPLLCVIMLLAAMDSPCLQLA